MIPEEPPGAGQGRRAVLALLAFAVTALIIYLLFASGFGRPRPAAVAAPAAVPVPQRAALAVVSGDLWLTYLPAGLERSGGGAVEPSGAWARFGTAGRFVEAQVEPAADWASYQRRATVLDPRSTVVRGRPAVAGRAPGGGRLIVWLERAGTGAWIRVSDSLAGELVPIAASVKGPVGD
ncbi:hypothetical protein GBF35_04625 [Nonomuraea phyllanthi]|uniref:hypothetical protein n=1 Tax=Nonomuraea phyllanthi TaxID=2219224 RepID=UPI001293DD6D|nr:hypothetical protein [Nonomuraea phyllanthi]QFY06053.1 hypothetical protein GBF35_04625 [Nonomuraea phyllanthi]